MFISLNEIHKLRTAAAATSTVHAFHHFARLKFIPRYPANTGGPKICILWLDAPEAAQIFIAGLFPLGYQQSVGYALIQAPLVQILGDGLLLTVQIKNISRSLVVQPEYRPAGFYHPFAFVCLIFNYKNNRFSMISKGTK